MSVTRFLPVLYLSMLCTLSCAGCGTTHTSYTFPDTARQRSRILQTVDSTSRVLGFTRQTDRTYEDAGSFFHTYLNGPLTIQTTAGEGKAYVDLRVDGRAKTPAFIRAERALTPALQHVDSRVTIKTGYYQNPMM